MIANVRVCRVGQGDLKGCLEVDWLLHGGRNFTVAAHDVAGKAKRDKELILA